MAKHSAHAGGHAAPMGAARRWRLGLVAVLLVLAAASRHLGDRWFYWPDHEVHGSPESLGIQAEPVAFAAPDGPSLCGWWLPARGAAQGTVVYCHGNHANLTHHARFVTWLPARGFQVLIFDYRGFGQSTGHPTRDGTVADAVAAIDFALARDPRRTVVFGHSLGGAIGIVAAAQRPAVRAVIAESTFPSYRAAAGATAPALQWLMPWFVSAGQDPLDALAALPPRPLLVIHGGADHIAPIALGRALHAAAHEPRQWLEVAGAGHETPWVRDGPRFETAVAAFLTDALARPASTPATGR